MLAKFSVHPSVEAAADDDDEDRAAVLAVTSPQRSKKAITFATPPTIVAFASYNERFRC